MDPDAALRERTHEGASGNLGLEHLDAWVAGEWQAVAQQQQRFAGAIDALVGTAEQGVAHSRKG
jgi:hypothetical protein